jgi:hypothetical protein
MGQNTECFNDVTKPNLEIVPENDPICAEFEGILAPTMKSMPPSSGPKSKPSKKPITRWQAELGLAYCP